MTDRANGRVIAPMRTPFLFALVLAVGCGARTVADDYRDAGRPDDVAPPDVTPPDVVEPDRPVPEELPPACPAGRTLCNEACVDAASEDARALGAIAGATCVQLVPSNSHVSPTDVVLVAVAMRPPNST